MRKLLNMLKKDDNAYSVGRICAVVGFVVWVLVTLWLAFLTKPGAIMRAAPLVWWRYCWCSWATRPSRREPLGFPKTTKKVYFQFLGIIVSTL